MPEPNQGSQLLMLNQQNSLQRHMCREKRQYFYFMPVDIIQKLNNLFKYLQICYTLWKNDFENLVPYSEHFIFFILYETFFQYNWPPH